MRSLTFCKRFPSEAEHKKNFFFRQTSNITKFLSSRQFQGGVISHIVYDFFSCFRVKPKKNAWFSWMPIIAKVPLARISTQMDSGHWYIPLNRQFCFYFNDKLRIISFFLLKKSEWLHIYYNVVVVEIITLKIIKVLNTHTRAREKRVTRDSGKKSRNHRVSHFQKKKPQKKIYVIDVWLEKQDYYKPCFCIWPSIYVACML